MKKKQAARVLNDTLRAHTNCYTPRGSIVKATHIMAINNNETISALWAARIYLTARRDHGVCPKIVCVDDTKHLGEFAKYLNQIDIEKMLISLGIPQEKIIMSGKKNYIEVADEICATQKASIIFSAPQRISLLVENDINSSKYASNYKLLVINQRVEEILNSKHNGRSLCGGALLYIELEEILRQAEMKRLSPSKRDRSSIYAIASDIIRRKNTQNRWIKRLYRMAIKLTIIASSFKRGELLQRDLERFILRLVKEGLYRDDDLIMGKRLERYCSAGVFYLDTPNETLTCSKKK